MVNVTLLWLLLIPVALAFANMVILPKLDVRTNIKDAAFVTIIGLMISIVVMTAAFFMGKGSRTSDTEVLNGQITSKSRDHDTYLEKYDCNCRNVCTGSGQQKQCNRVCDTCTRRHWTVTWSASSTVGGFRIDHLDRTNDSVYNEPDPAKYVKTVVGEACSTTNSYTNYIKAVPESLFRPSSENVKVRFASMIPEYPLNVYDMWKLDRVLAIKVPVPNLAEWNAKLADALKTLGPKKQANAVIVLVNTSDPAYMYALQDAWVNGKKNDVIVIIGATKFPQKADWVRVLALSNGEMFKIRLRDDIQALETLTADGVIEALTRNTLQSFQRKAMKDFAYLDDEINPPMWVNVTAVFIVFLGWLSLWIYAYRHRRNRY